MTLNEVSNYSVFSLIAFSVFSIALSTDSPAFSMGPFFSQAIYPKIKPAAIMDTILLLIDDMSNPPFNTVN
jgi:hypothetical protein